MVTTSEYREENGCDVSEIRIVCDGCGEVYCDTEDCSSWQASEGTSNEDVAWAVRNDGDYERLGWNHTDEDLDFCKKCAHYDADYLQRIVLHPINGDIKGVINASKRLLSEPLDVPRIQCGGKAMVLLPSDLVHDVKRMMIDYRRLLLRLNSQLHQSRAFLEDYKCDKDSADFFNALSAYELLVLGNECIENIKRK